MSNQYRDKYIMCTVLGLWAPTYESVSASLSKDPPKPLEGVLRPPAPYKNIIMSFKVPPYEYSVSWTATFFGRGFKIIIGDGL